MQYPKLTQRYLATSVFCLTLSILGVTFVISILFNKDYTSFTLQKPSNINKIDAGSLHFSDNFIDNDSDSTNRQGESDNYGIIKDVGSNNIASIDGAIANVKAINVLAGVDNELLDNDDMSIKPGSLVGVQKILKPTIYLWQPKENMSDVVIENIASAENDDFGFYDEKTVQLHAHPNSQFRNILVGHANVGDDVVVRSFDGSGEKINYFDSVDDNIEGNDKRIFGHHAVNNRKQQWGKQVVNKTSMSTLVKYITNGGTHAATTLRTTARINNDQLLHRQPEAKWRDIKNKKAQNNLWPSQKQRRYGSSLDMDYSGNYNYVKHVNKNVVNDDDDDIDIANASGDRPTNVINGSGDIANQFDAATRTFIQRINHKKLKQTNFSHNSGKTNCCKNINKQNKNAKRRIKYTHTKWRRKPLKTYNLNYKQSTHANKDSITTSIAYSDVNGLKMTAESTPLNATKANVNTNSNKHNIGNDINMSTNPGAVTTRNTVNVATSKPLRSARTYQKEDDKLVTTSATSFVDSLISPAWISTGKRRIFGNVKQSQERSRHLLLCEEAGGGELCRMLFKQL